MIYTPPGSTRSASWRKNQLAERRKSVGASEVKRVMDGDWHALWLLKTNREKPEDLTDVFRVGLGNVTETYNLWHLERRLTDAKMTLWAHGSIALANYPFITATPDATMLHDGNKYVVDAKHTNAYSDESKLTTSYWWQMQQLMLVLAYDHACITPIYGNNQGDAIWFEANYIAQKELIKMVSQFWSMVEDDIEPEEELTLGITTGPPVEVIRVEQMSSSNMWTDMAATFIQNHAARKANEAAEKGLKALIDKDVKVAWGRGLIATRAKNGNLSLRLLDIKAAKKWNLPVSSEKELAA